MLLRLPISSLEFPYLPHRNLTSSWQGSFFTSLLLIPRLYLLRLYYPASPSTLHGPHVDRPSHSILQLPSVSFVLVLTLVTSLRRSQYPVIVSDVLSLLHTLSLIYACFTGFYNGGNSLDLLTRAAGLAEAFWLWEIFILSYAHFL